METSRLNNKPLIVIVGPTASGKTSLAIKLASKYGGEIICADSRTIYRHMDIGTAKPSQEERALVPHHGLDLIEPGEYFSASDFKVYADQKIAEIRSRGNIPFLVGGSGLYVDSVIFDYKFGVKKDDTVRQKLEQMSIEELWKYCDKNNIVLPNNYKNKRYVIRSIENETIDIKRKLMPISNCIVVGITTEKDKLLQRIKKRVDIMLDSGVVGEAKMLAKKYGWDNEAMKSNIYRAIRESDELVDIKDKVTTLDWHLVKKQMTWFKRNFYIKWFNLDDAEEYISSHIAQNE